ncbi:hypothetical protein Tco_0396757 [Tanacetum coccineum]
MSTPSHFDSEIISQTNGAQSSRVPTPLLDDPYVAVRQAHLVDTDPKSEPFGDVRETEIPEPLPIAPAPVPSSDDPYLIVGQTHTLATRDTKSEPEGASSDIEEHVDAQRAEMWRAKYDDHRLIHDLLVQNTTIQHELQEMRDRATILEREGSRRGQ